MRTVFDAWPAGSIRGVRGREFRHGAGESGGRVGEQPAGLVHGVGGLVFASVGVRDPCLGLRVDSRGLLLGCFEDPVGFGVGVGQEFLRLFAAFADSPVGFLVNPLFAPRGLFDLFVRFFLRFGGQGPGFGPRLAEDGPGFRFGLVEDGLAFVPSVSVMMVPFLSAGAFRMGHPRRPR